MLRELPLIFILVGLAAYAVLAGADFGAGMWILVSRKQVLREHARHAMGPVWEANHVWLIFVFVVSWTAYPKAFASIASTLAVPLLLAAIGIILRGTAYALRAQVEEGAVATRIERVLGVSSILTPFALGATAGAIASGRVPVGNAAGDLLTSWFNLTGVTIGVLGVATSSYLAAVYLSADAARSGDQMLVHAFRARALFSGVVAGTLALAALIVVHTDAPRIWHGLTTGWGPVPLAASIVAGVITLGLVAGGRYQAARVAAATAVAAVIAGWAVAQSPRLLPGLTIRQAAAGHTTLVALVIAVAGGALIPRTIARPAVQAHARGPVRCGPSNCRSALSDEATGGPPADTARRRGRSAGCWSRMHCVAGVLGPRAGCRVAARLRAGRIHATHDTSGRRTMTKQYRPLADGAVHFSRAISVAEMRRVWVSTRLVWAWSSTARRSTALAAPRL